MSVPRIACLDVLAEDVQAETRRVAGSDFALSFAKSDDLTERYELSAGADFLLIGSTPVTAELLQCSPRVRLVQKYGIGVDKIDIRAAQEAGVPVAIAAGSNAGPVSELALGLMIAVNRRMVYADRKVRQGLWPKLEMRSSCFQLDGKTIGLLGFGAIAQMTLRRLRGFDVKVIYHSSSRAPREVELALGARSVSLDELLSQSDVLSIHVPLTAETRNMIDGSALARMKSSAILVNTARGEVVDEKALFEALAGGRLRGAGLDVFATEPALAESPLFGLDNVVVMPHAGGGAFDNVTHIMAHAIGNMRKLIAGEPLPPADIVVAPHAFQEVLP